ncbi:MAG: hypothetical protein WC862_01435 [Patescibacteria group bacterium]
MSERRTIPPRETTNGGGDGRITRRQAMLGVLGAVVLPAGAVLGEQWRKAKAREEAGRGGRGVRGDGEAAGEFRKESEENAAEEDAISLFAELVEIHPELEEAPHLLLTDERYEEDRETRRFFDAAAYDQLVALRVVRGSDVSERREYLDPRLTELWRNKLDLMEGDDAEICGRIMKAIAEEPPEKILFFENILRPTGRHCDEIRAYFSDHHSDDRFFNDMIDNKLIIALSVHELLPREYENSYGRIAVYKALIRAGFQPQRVPSASTDTLSFGAVQMSRGTYEEDDSFNELRENFGLPEHTQDCLSLDEQLRAAALLQFRNLRRLLHGLSEGERRSFTDLFESARIEEKQKFLASVLGAYHHTPRRAREAFQSLFAGESIAELASLPDAQQAFFSALAPEASNDNGREITRLYAEWMDKLVGELQP